MGSKKTTNVTRHSTHHSHAYDIDNRYDVQTVSPSVTTGAYSQAATGTLVARGKGARQTLNIDARREVVNPGYDKLLDTARHMHAASLGTGERLVGEAWTAIDGGLQFLEKQLEVNKSFLDRQQSAQATFAASRAAENRAEREHIRALDTSGGARDITSIIQASVIPIGVGLVAYLLVGKKVW